MPDKHQKTVAHMFQIKVSPNEEFSYEPNEEWKYGRTDHICFKCNVPFKIEFLRVSGDVSKKSLDTQHPNGITALTEVETGMFAAHTNVPKRGRPPNPGNPPIRKFQYKITATIDLGNGQTKDIEQIGKNGSDIC